MYSANGVDGNRRSRGATAAAVALAVAYFIFLMTRFAPAYSSMDSHEYHNQARLIATTGKPYFTPDDNTVRYIGFTWRRNKGDRYYTMAPPGFPLALAVVYKLLGPVASLYLNPVLAAVCILLVFAIAARWAGPWWGVAAAALCAAFPHLSQQALSGYAHIFSLFLLLLVLHLVNRWHDTGGVAFPFFAGLALGTIPSVRTPEAIFIPAVCIYALLVLPPRGRAKQYEAFALGLALPLAALMYYNYVSFGAFYQTGYKLRRLDVDVTFSIAYFRNNLPGILRGILWESGGVMSIAGFVGSVLMCFRRQDRPKGLLLLMITVPLFVMITAYFVPPNIYSMRYLLPLFPLHAIACVWLLSRVPGGKAVRVALCLGVMIFTAAWGLPRSLDKMNELYRRHSVMVQVESALEKDAPGDSVVIANEPLCQYLEYFGKWVLATDSERNRRRSGLNWESRHPALPREFMDGVRDLSAGGKKVFWIVESNREDALKRMNPPGYTLEKLDEIPIPPPPPGTTDGIPELKYMESGYDIHADAWILEEPFIRMMSDRSLVVYKWIINGR